MACAYGAAHRLAFNMLTLVISIKKCRGFVVGGGAQLESAAGLRLGRVSRVALGVGDACDEGRRILRGSVALWLAYGIRGP